MNRLKKFACSMLAALTMTLIPVTGVQAAEVSDIHCDIPSVGEMLQEIEIIHVPSDEVELIGLIVMGEAEGESEEGKRLVIDTILNRRDSEKFPNNVNDVIYQKSQFSCVWNGRLKRVQVTDYIRDLVVEEYAERLNDQVLYFTAGGYSKYGTPLFQEGNHYFSGK